MVSSLRYQQFFNYLHDAVFIVDADGVIADWNTAAEQLFGYSPQQIIGRSPALLQAAEDAPRLTDLIFKGQSEVSHWAGETTLRHRDGEPRICQATLAQLVDDSGARAGAVAVVRETNDDGKLEQHLARTLQELDAVREQLDLYKHNAAQQQGLTLIGEMASGISHSLINMLGPSVLLSDLLLSGSGQSEQSRELIDAIKTGTMNAVDLVKRLGSLSRRKTLKEQLSPVDLHALIEQMPALTTAKWQREATEAGRDISFELQLESVPLIEGNAEELRQCLLDLIDNAVDAMTHGGVICLRLQNRPDSILLTVQDSGRGMTEQELQRCFEPFFTSKAAGVGLGLSLCTRVVEDHGGSIAVNSAPCEGTSIEIELPVNSTVSSLAQDSELESSHASYRILYIDDEPIARKSMSLLLETLGHETDLADNAYAGIEQFKQRSYDLVISDFSMPGLSGRDVAATIKAVDPAAIVILATGWSSAHMTPGAGETAPEDGIVEKPITIDKLQQMLATVMARSSVIQ